MQGLGRAAVQPDLTTARVQVFENLSLPFRAAAFANFARGGNKNKGLLRDLQSFANPTSLLFLLTKLMNLEHSNTSQCKAAIFWIQL